MRIRVISAMVIAAIMAVAVIGCQTAKPSIAPQESAIEVEASGFSPNGGKEHATIDISLLFGNREAITSWKVEIANTSETQKTWTSDAGYLPASLSWDGRNDSGALAPEGRYVAGLSIDYGKTFLPVSVQSRDFVLDLSPPSGSITVDPPQLIPSEKGIAAPATITITASSKLATMGTWSLDIYDETGGLFKSFSGNWPNASATWDGSSVDGRTVVPGATYKAVAIVRNEFGNSAQLKADIPIADIPLAAEQDRVQPRLGGFSPKSDTLPRAMDLLLTFGNRAELVSWKLSVSHVEQGVQNIWTGNAAQLPSLIAWDGTTDKGASAPEGAYTAVLSIDYGKAFKPVLVRSRSFVLDVTPPVGNVSAVPVKLAPDGKGGIQPVTFTVYGDSKVAALDSWQLNLLGADGATVATFKGTWPDASVTWDGRLARGGTADPTKSFTYLARVRDQYGNVGEARGSLTSGELPSVQSGVAIIPKTEGFSPNGDETMDTLALALSFGQPSAVKGWKVAISAGGLGVLKTVSGDASKLPASVVWEGKTDAGKAAPEGIYTATLSIDYGTMFKAASATSAPFALDITPPKGSIALSTPLFSPIESSDTITLTLDATSLVAKIDSWSVGIFDPAGNLFRAFAGKWPANRVIWDGKGSGGEMVQSAEDYQVVAKLRDQFGIVGEVKSVIPVDILVERRGDGYRILASRVFFKPFTADYQDVAADLARQNSARLDSLAEKLKKFPGYRIRIVGHAVMINWDNPVRGKAEQEAVLIPLSKARAEAVKKALVERGLDEAMFTTEGVGASDQLVPDSDSQNRWQNRRVALFLEK